MTEPTRVKPSSAFWVIAIIALLWNLSGLFAFFSEVFITEEALSSLTDAQRQLYESTPVWLKVFYGIAVFGGTLGCIVLLLRKKLSIQLFTISLIAIIIQMSYSLFMTNAIEVYGIVSAIMPMVVIGIGVFLVWYSRRSKNMGWIK